MYINKSLWSEKPKEKVTTTTFEEKNSYKLVEELWKLNIHTKKFEDMVKIGI